MFGRRRGRARQLSGDVLRFRPSEQRPGEDRDVASKVRESLAKFLRSHAATEANAGPGGCCEQFGSLAQRIADSATTSEREVRGTHHKPQITDPPIPRSAIPRFPDSPIPDSSNPSP